MRNLAFIFLLLGTSFSVVNSQPVRVTLSPVSAEVGETVTVQIQAFDGAATGNLAYALHYDPTALTLQGVTEHAALQPAALLASRPSVFPDDSGTLHVEHVFAAGLPGATPIASLTFVVRDTSNTRDVTLRFEDLTAYATDGSALAVVGEDGDISVVPTSIEATILPEQFVLHANYPNPFNPTTTLAYDVPEATALRLEVFDLLGRRVTVLLDDVQPPGWHQIQWDASRMASGVYFARMIAQNTQTGRQQIQTQKMLLVK